ncbi:MAG: hypothetical protein MJZ64_08330 [Paludibacteraceae bacterium]|nr:hypothetical protein [Paludibacteraceae bacterium]
MVLKINLNPVQELDDETKVISYNVYVVANNGNVDTCKQLGLKLNEQLNQQPLNSEDEHVIDCIRQVLCDEGVMKENTFIYGNILWGAGCIIKSLEVILPNY